MNTVFRGAFVALALLASASAASIGSAQTARALKGKTIVLVHGAFADGSSWSKVIPLLEAKGLHVVAVQNPLTSLKDDVSATQRVIEQQNGPVILVGHSWGGTVITQAGNDEKVKALVYVAAFAPEQGQSVNDLLKGLPTPPWAPALRKDSAGFLTLSTDAILEHFAPDVPKSEARLVAATRGPLLAAAFDDKVTEAAWRNKPSWDVITGADHMISAELQETMAKRIGAKIVKTNASHVVLLSQPEHVAAAIIAAADAVK